MKPRDHLLLSLLFFASVLFAGASVAAQTPEILKVEPPSWWVGSSLNPVRVLIRGRNLRGAVVQAVGSGFRIVGAPKINQSGSYVFVDLAILPDARPGERSLRPSEQILLSWRGLAGCHRSPAVLERPRRDHPVADALV